MTVARKTMPFPLIVTTSLALLLADTRCQTADNGAAEKVFEERIAPIFKSPNPSSCVKCHLASVDLKDYILPSAKDTFLALRGQGLIDLHNPEKSKILALINRGAEEKAGSTLIPAKLQKIEYEAFAAWIKACATDPSFQNLPKPEKVPTLSIKPIDIVRHSRKDRVLESFERNIWAMRFRCMNCHTEGTSQNDKLRKEHGDRVAWVKKDSAEATMEYLLKSKLIDVKEPAKSRLLTKPLGIVEHGGGVKFVLGDQGYKAFRAWIDDVAAMRTGKYAKTSDLPAKEVGPKRFGTDVWFKLTNTPDAWADKLLQVDKYAWDAKLSAWEKQPIATSDRMVFGKGKLWQHNLTLIATEGSERANKWQAAKPTLPAGKYLVKLYVDVQNRIGSNWKAVLGADDYVGQVEIQAKWNEGYGNMTSADGMKVKR